MQRTRTVAIGIIAMGILFAGSTEVRADDTALFTTSVPPNVLFIFDNSGSMNNIVWHPEFEAGAIYPGDPKERRISIGAGIPNAPRVSVGPLGDGGGGGPCQDMVVVITSEGEGFTECPGGRPNSGLRIRAWREL